MEIYRGEDPSRFFEFLKERVLKGQVGIVPTDTIYGLSGSALDEGAIEKVLRIKKRESPLSIIPHSIEWLRQFIPAEEQALFDAHVNDYRGRFTMRWRYAEAGEALPLRIHSTGLLSVRLPAHWITEFTRYAGIPLFSTSVNIHHEAPMTDMSDLPEDIRANVDFCVYEGPLTGPPSAIVHCNEGWPFRLEDR